MAKKTTPDPIRTPLDLPDRPKVPQFPNTQRRINGQKATAKRVARLSDLIEADKADVTRRKGE